MVVEREVGVREKSENLGEVHGPRPGVSGLVEARCVGYASKHSTQCDSFYQKEGTCPSWGLVLIRDLDSGQAAGRAVWLSRSVGVNVGLREGDLGESNLAQSTPDATMCT